MDKVRYCRLCLEAIPIKSAKITRPYSYLKNEDCKNATKETTELCFETMLLNNFPELNVNLTKVPLICYKCADQFMFASLFKFKLLEVEGKVKKVKGKRGYINLRNAVDGDKKQRYRLVCRLCLQFIKGGKFRPMFCKDNYYRTLVDELKVCFKDVDFEISQNPLMCDTCIFEIDRYCKFYKRCFETEKTLLHYFDTHYVKMNTVDLSDIICEVKRSSIYMNCPDKLKVNKNKSDCKYVKPLRKPNNSLALTGGTFKEVEVSNIKIDLDPQIETNQKSICVQDPVSNNIDGLTNKSVIFQNFIEMNTEIKVKEETDSSSRESTHSVDETYNNLTIKQENWFEPNCVIKEEFMSDTVEDIPEFISIEEDPLLLEATPDIKTEHSSQVNISPTKSCQKCVITQTECTHLKKYPVWHACPTCGYETHWKHHLTRHMRIHDKGSTDMKLYRCKICPFKSKFKHLVIRHNTEDHGAVFNCEHCPFTTKFKFTLTEHVRDEHVSSQSWFRCPECPYISKWKYHIKRHMFQHQK